MVGDEGKCWVIGDSSVSWAMPMLTHSRMRRAEWERNPERDVTLCFPGCDTRLAVRSAAIRLEDIISTCRRRPRQSSWQKEVAGEAMCRNKRLVEDERGKSSREVHPDQVLGGPGPCYDRACQPINTSLRRFQRNHCPFTEGRTRALSSRRKAQTSNPPRCRQSLLQSI